MRLLLKKIMGQMPDHHQDPLYRAGLDIHLPDHEKIEYMMPTPDEVLPAGKYIRMSLGLFTSKKWPKDKVIKVIWADGDADIQAKTMGDWQLGIVSKIRAAGNKAFDIVVTTDPAQADMRVSFTQNNQAWSYVGTDCGYIAKTGAITMNLGWHIRYRENQGNERFGTGCHEMIHGLGYIHTLQSPACVGVFEFNKPYVYAKYARIGWSKEQVDAQVITPQAAGQINDNGCDFDSIECYQLDPGEAYYVATKQPVINKRNVNFSKLDDAKLISDYGGSIPPPPPPPPPASKLISIGKPASMSSLYDPMPNSNPGYYGANRINDGVIGMSSIAHTLSEVNPWIQIDLGASMTVSSIKLYNRIGCPKCVGRLNKFRVYLTDAPVGSGYPTGHVYENSSVVPDGGVINIPISGKGRYVRLVANNVPATYLHLTEMQVWGG